MQKQEASGREDKESEALRESESWLRLILENTSDGINIVEYDPRTHKRRLVMCNDRYVEMSGRSREELMEAENLDNLIHPIVQDGPFRELVRTGLSSEGRTSWLRPDGKENTYEWTATRLKVGDKYHIIGIDRDITERIKAEEKLRRLAMIAEQAAEGIGMADLDGIIQFINPSWARMHGYETGEELIGKHISVFHTTEQMKTFVIPFNDKVERDGQHRGESEQKRKDGTTFPSEMAVTLFKDEEGEPVGMLAFATDITERKQSEEALLESEETARALLNATLDSALLIDPDGALLAVNDTAATRGFGKPASELIGKNVRDTLRSGLAEHRLVQSDEVVRSGKPLRFEDEHDGVWLDHSVYPIFDAEGRVVRLAIYARDITDRKKAEEVLRKSERDLRKRVRELNCLYQITEVVNTCGDALDALLQGIVNVLPEASRHPESACARITVSGKKYQTDNFRKSQTKLAADILVAEEKVGVVGIFCFKKSPPDNKSPFLKEERSLIDTVAARIGRNIERIQTRKQLLAGQSALEQKNIALHEVMAGIQDEKKEFGRRIVSNVEKIIMPLLHTLEQELPKGQRKYLDLLKGSIEDITLPFADSLSKEFTSLTPTEIRICNLIRRGLSTKEIAGLQHVSPATVNKHRERIRHKLQITNKDINLATYLETYMSDHETQTK